MLSFFFRLDRMCNSNGSKTRINVKQEVVSVFSFNSSLLTPGPGPGGAEFRCHLELYLPSSSYGFSVFIEEMSLSGSLLSGCHHDYVQFGRDILFVTTHLRWVIFPPRLGYYQSVMITCQSWGPTNSFQLWK